MATAKKKKAVKKATKKSTKKATAKAVRKVRCAAKTATGKQCKNMVAPPAKLCVRHKK